MQTGVRIMPDLLIGTTKGLFILDHRNGWQVSGPHCDGAPINHAIGTAAGEIWAGGGNAWVGIGVWHRRDGVWSRATGQFGEADAIWSLARNADRLLAGTRPATLWESRDDGQTWAKLPALTNLEGAQNWDPGAAGLVLHSNPDGAGWPVVGRYFIGWGVCIHRWGRQLGAAGASVKPPRPGGPSGTALGRRGNSRRKRNFQMCS